MTVDPITLEVVRSGVTTIAEEMRAILVRSARAPLLKEAGDFSCALTDARGRLIAQGRDIPIHLGVMAFTVQEFLRRVPVESVAEGDVYLTNDPEVGGNHLPDVKAITPVFVGGRLIAFAICLAHWPDIGGARAGSYVPFARDIHMEGLVIPPVRIASREGPRREILDLIFANVRGREEREGDLLAQCATNEVASRRIVEMCHRFGVEVVVNCFQRFQDESESLMRLEIRRLPEGTYAGEDFLDDDAAGGDPVPIRVAVTIKDGAMNFDFSGTAPQIPGPLNATRFVAASAVYYCCRAVCGPEIPANEGCYRPISVSIPAGAVLNPAPDAPVVGGNHETSQRVVDAVMRALAQAVPERITAGATTTSGILIFSGRRGERPFIFYEAHGGGEGGHAHRDGTSAVRNHMTNVMNTPAEVVEAEYPLRVESHTLRPGSFGPGRHRGGLGLRRAYRVLAETAELTTMAERCRIAPWGFRGGQDGQTMRIWLIRDGQRRALGGKEVLTLRRDDVVEVESCGGGGYGPPEARPADLHRDDVREGYVDGEA